MDQSLLSSIKPVILLGIEEDIKTGDITTDAIFDDSRISSGTVFAKEAGVFCGEGITEYVYSFLDTRISAQYIKHDGDYVDPGMEILTVKGPTTHILSGERLVLNILQRLCGIATETSRLVDAVKGSTIKILDTRKTLPGFRLLDKYAVKTGGGVNHRMGLYDMVMIKDNHITAAGSIANAVKKVRDLYNNKFQVEVETTDLEEVTEALVAGADIIMLDNMDNETVGKALEITRGKAKVEVSGNITLERLGELKPFPIDYISVGSLTHSVRAFDLSMKFDF